MGQERAFASVTPVRDAETDTPDYQKDNQQRSQDRVIDQKARPDCRQQRDQGTEPQATQECEHRSSQADLFQMQIPETPPSPLSQEQQDSFFTSF
jgi:hypothetical protein